LFADAVRRDGGAKKRAKRDTYRQTAPKGCDSSALLDLRVPRADLSDRVDRVIT